MYLVFDVGGTTIKYAWMAGDGTIEEKAKIPTPIKEGQTIDDFVETIGNVYDCYKMKDKVEGIAMGLPGQVDIVNGVVYGGGGIRYMHNVHLMDLVSKRCDGLHVSLENDGKCAALAEVWLGNAKDVEDAYVLVFGTGIGGAMVKDRRIHRGKHLLAGEVSYIFEKIDRGDLDRIQQGEKLSVYEAIEKMPFTWSAISATGSVCFRLAKKKGIPFEEVTGEKIYQWAREGDTEATDILEEMYFSIAKQCCNLYVIYNPEVILIGGGISAEPAFLAGIQKYVDQLKKISLVFNDIKIDVCKFRNDSNLLGALYNFKQIYEEV